MTRGKACVKDLIRISESHSLLIPIRPTNRAITIIIDRRPEPHTNGNSEKIKSLLAKKGVQLLITHTDRPSVNGN